MEYSPRKFFAATFLVVVLSVPAISNASLVEVDLFTTGDNLLTRDTVTGLEWLDLTAATSLSVNDILNGIGNSWYQDFQYATRDQVDNLVFSAFADGWTPANYVTLAGFLGLTTKRKPY